MNDPSAIPPTDEETSEPQGAPPAPISQIENLIRRHPVVAGLASLGFGCAIGIVAREWLTPPPPPKHRVLQLLEDIQHRLTEFAEPAHDRASHLTDEGVNAVKHGWHSVAGTKLGSRFSRLFS